MKIFNCFHPKVIQNQYTGKLVTAKCGKCYACRNARITDWINRLDMESDCHKYTVFCTLTYNDLNVPQIIRLRKEDYATPAYLNGETGELIDLLDIKENFTPYDKQYIYRNKVLNVLDKSDFQKFFKRLRYYFDQTDKGAKLRYYVCGEYGPSTFRPHGHLLLFFDSEKCASKIELLLRQSWQHGVLYDPHFVSGSAAAYCAAYINSTASLPRCYLHKQIKPFTLFSKSPAIGSSYSLLADDKKIFHEGITTFQRFDKSAHIFKTEFIPRSVKNRIFPRCQRFGDLSNDDRTFLYRKVEEYPVTFSATRIAEELKRKYLDHYNDTAFARYLKDIAYKVKPCIRLIPDKSSFKNDYKDYPFLPSDPIVTPFYSQKTVTREFCFNSLVRFARTLKTVQKNARMFHVSIPYYVSKISKYYDDLEKYRLKQDYLFQQEYFKTHPLSDFVYFDIALIRRLKTIDYPLLSKADKQVVNTCGLHPDSDSRIKVSLKKSHAFNDFVIFHSKIAHDLVKQKKVNDYVMSKKDKHGNIIQPLNI